MNEHEQIRINLVSADSRGDRVMVGYEGLTRTRMGLYNENIFSSEAEVHIMPQP